MFSRLWERLGIAEVLGDLLKIRGFGFAVERAVLVSVLHRLFVSGSDRACENWMADYKIDGIEGLTQEARYDGIFVLRTNARVTPLQASSLPRPSAGGGSVPPDQGADAHPANLSQLGRGDPRSRVLLVPGTAAAAGIGGSLRRQSGSPTPKM
ncbi:hypothetical protein [Mesorhizobium sp.]|uniref:hypothetical protein n=1 Tax=Mesorhizobium sp. TaxID=1871066 RepID=UPI0025D8C743|nr:hypothetical protein [Mesorhizobium sp.]